MWKEKGSFGTKLSLKFLVFRCRLHVLADSESLFTTFIMLFA